MATEAKFANHIVGVSADSLKAIPPEYLHKGVVIHGAIDRDRLKPFTSAKDMRSSLNIGENDKVALYLGRISPEKRVELAIDAMRYMPGNWKMLVVGDTRVPISPTCLYNNHRIQFCGPTAFPGDYLQIADCFISPSRTEGFGLSVVEAIASGVPVVANQVGILSELNIATTIPIESNPQSFAAAMIRAEKDRDKAIRDQETVLEMFTISAFNDSWSNLL
jgi:glycosyltransferase involved in cell wall biosynthesis